MALAHTARTFGQRPSKLLGLRDKVAALDFDTAATFWLLRSETPAQEQDDEWTSFEPTPSAPRARTFTKRYSAEEIASGALAQIFQQPGA